MGRTVRDTAMAHPWRIYWVGRTVGDTVVANPWRILDGRTVGYTVVAPPWGILHRHNCERYCNGTPVGDILGWQNCGRYCGGTLIGVTALAELWVILRYHTRGGYCFGRTV